ncbi:hypothetical protein [Niveibacterium sp. SC-1]|uniref:carboxylesterase family protein n=1 Tax=Niveibacterium sp. SC-1 TaxID=3135646 RepID=UPI00311E2A8A
MIIEQHVLSTPRAALPYLFSRASQDKAPLVVFLHGAKDRGQDLSRLLAWGFPRVVAQSAPLPYHWLALQIPEETTWPQWKHELFGLIDDLAARHGASEVLLSGFSLGSAGTWTLGAEHADRFAALVIVSGRLPEALDDHTLGALKDTPVWIFHGEQDDKAPASAAAVAADRLGALGGKVRLTLIPGGDHFIADAVYGSSELQEWLASGHELPRAAERETAKAAA